MRGSGWQSGIASAVRLAARMPASRATSTTPPFARAPARTRRMAAGAMRIRPRATASRGVIGFAETSTMRARPVGVEVAQAPRARSRPRHVALQEVAEEEGRGLLARLGLRPLRLEHDERVGARVGHEVARAHRAQRARPRAARPRARTRAGRWARRPERFVTGAPSSTSTRGRASPTRALHPQEGGAHEEVEGDLGRDRIAGQAEDERVAAPAEDERRARLDGDLREQERDAEARQGAPRRDRRRPPRRRPRGRARRRRSHRPRPRRCAVAVVGHDARASARLGAGSRAWASDGRAVAVADAARGRSLADVHELVAGDERRRRAAVAPTRTRALPDGREDGERRGVDALGRARATTSPARTSLPRGATFWPARTASRISTRGRPSRARVFSTCCTAVAPAGTGAPVMICDGLARAASVASGAWPGADLARDLEDDRRRLATSAARSA